MRISGFTIARDVIKYNYPTLASIQSILPLCDEFIVNVGDSNDGTLDLIRSLKNPKIKIIENAWDSRMGKEVLSYQTNLALAACTGDWAFYLQSDEVIHENDLKTLRQCMLKYKDRLDVDALRFRWLHFYGSYYRYRIDRGWYQKQDRIIRNNGKILSYGDAFGFKRRDGQPLQRANTGCLLYHYGWVHPEDVMMRRRINAQNIGFVQLEEKDKKDVYNYGDLTRFPAYFGSHPAVMNERVQAHELSREDWKVIEKSYWWNPYKICRARHKTWRRVKHAIK